MIPGLNFSTHIGLRAARAGDQPFFEQLFKASRTDLWLAGRDPDYIGTVLDQQWHSREAYYRQTFPRAMYLVIEIQGERAGRLVLDVGPNEVRIVDIHLVPRLQGRGYGTELLCGLQRASRLSGTPLSLVAASNNPRAMQLYRRLGFVEEAVDPLAVFMAWYPGNGVAGDGG